MAMRHSFVLARDPIKTRYARAPLRFFAAPASQCNLLFIFSFFQEKQLSLTETIKYEINKYMFKFFIFNFFLFVAAK